MKSSKPILGSYYINNNKKLARISGQDSNLFIVLEDEKKIFVSLSKCQFNLKGDSKTTLEISWQEEGLHFLYCHDERLTDLLKSIATLKVKQKILAVLKEQKKILRKEKHRVKFYITLTAFLIILCYFFVFNFFTLANHWVPYEWEEKIGKVAYQKYLTDKQKINSPQVKKAMGMIIKHLDSYDDASIGYKWTVINTPLVNAFALPGGYIIITTGLLKLTKNPKETAGVLAHEMSHCIQRHSLKKLLRTAGTAVVFGLLLNDNSALLRLLKLSSTLEGLSYNRQQERNADKKGVQILLKAGIHPKYFISFLRKIKEKNKGIKGIIPEFIRTHPLTEERIKAILKNKNIKNKHQFNINWQLFLKEL